MTTLSTFNVMKVLPRRINTVKGVEKRTGDKNNPMLFSNVKSMDGEK